LEEKVAAPVYKDENTAVKRAITLTLYSQKLALTSPTSGGRSVGIVRSRIQTMGYIEDYKNIYTFISCSLLKDNSVWRIKYSGFRSNIPL
jgi:hypothetical protein